MLRDGRRPAPDPTRPNAQLNPISDETRTVSNTHARLELRHDTWYVTDLGSTNGTKVNGQKVREAPLPSDTTITIGRTDLVFRVVAVAAEGAAR